MSWFRPRTYGYGATPSSWQGWAAVAAFVAVEVALAWAILGFDENAGAGRVIAFLALSALLVVGFVRLTRSRTSGEWRWRWGRDHSRQD